MNRLPSITLPVADSAALSATKTAAEAFARWLKETAWCVVCGDYYDPALGRTCSPRCSAEHYD